MAATLAADTTRVIRVPHTGWHDATLYARLAAVKVLACSCHIIVAFIPFCVK